ncbi:MAG: sulfite oxidase-like oxidoreductase [candidate division KSB1 bacterium]|nr:sulfite oxidase-like oxidoreductase [candidate division KSB1 bacterium]MDZ7272490.1 sulfite oxidase-like oxidoreductase [candidate division KSB1 bacterium]MDZ7284486.1 sulfite oxidase-like oxidoreductase [candidate division KSB1 bacterium]MDZ7297118.1 sulfite oxidase-like oxidoreductase [candidate division KSB1 bacterium]MDZ7306566.1 sulfite oxidase-like oxidoreductase [candidate division KSB1 bacterium]
MSFFDPIKRVQRLRQADPRRQPDAELRERIPPGQYRTEKFPVLTYGETPVVDLKDWRLKVWGLVENPITLTWEEFQALPRKKIHVDIHCVTRWSMLDTEWEGVPFSVIAELAKPLPTARVVMEHSYGGYTTNMLLEEMYDAGVLLADTYDGRPLARDHGGPLRLVVPRLYFWKSAKWLNGLEFLARNLPGFWERYGYHMHGDPWTEERFG